jgi:preprotein translocase subunit YajC
MELIILPLLFVAMWFVLIRPQQARLRAQRDLVASLQAGDRVVTAGGILGTITVLGESELRLEVSPGVELEVLRGAVSRRITPAGGAGGADGRDDQPEEPG